MRLHALCVVVLLSVAAVRALTASDPRLLERHRRFSIGAMPSRRTTETQRSWGSLMSDSLVSFLYRIASPFLYWQRRAMKAATAAALRKPLTLRES